MSADLPQKFAIGPNEPWERARDRITQAWSKLDTWARGEPLWESIETEFKGGSTDVDVKTSRAQPPRGAWVESLREKDADAVPTQAWSFHWRPGDSGIVIRSIPGLTNDTLYVLRIRICWG